MPEPEGYRVTNYDGTTHEWTIIRTGTFYGKFLRKRRILRCNFFQWSSRDAALGPDKCHLQFGKLIAPNPMPGPGHESEFLDVYEMPDEVLSIAQGTGQDRIMEQFKTLHYDLSPDEN